MNFKMYVEFLHVSVIIFNGKCLKKREISSHCPCNSDFITSSRKCVCEIGFSLLHQQNGNLR